MKITKGDIEFNVMHGGESWDFWSLVQQNRWEPYTYQILSRLLDKQHSYVDVGAWIGPTVLYGCQLAKKCYAIEPDPVALRLLNQNINLNKFHNIIVLDCAIGDENGEVEIGCFGDKPIFQFGSSMTSVLGKVNPITVQSITLPELFTQYNIDDCSLIKMDIEGGEFAVLPQAIDFLEQQRIPLYLSIHYHRLEDTSQLKQWLDLLCQHHIETTHGISVSTHTIYNQRIREIVVYFK
jgi:FkbM family methyltransferase